MKIRETGALRSQCCKVRVFYRNLVIAVFKHDHYDAVEVTRPRRGSRHIFALLLCGRSLLLGWHGIRRLSERSTRQCEAQSRHAGDCGEKHALQESGPES